MKTFVFWGIMCLFVGVAHAACYDTECDYDMMMDACGTTDNVRCTYQSGNECDATPWCYCSDSSLEFIEGVGCACPYGSYGNPSYGGTCSDCPNNGISWSGENTTIAGCHIPSGKTMSDSAGQFTYTSDCYYKQ